MNRSVSPDDDGGALALLAAAESLTGLPLGDDTFDVFIKEESSSPVADDEKPLVMARVRQPPKLLKPGLGSARRLQGADQQHLLVKPAKHGRASAASKALGLRASHTPPIPAQPVVPRRIEDWEPWKGVLHELYITQNRILRDIITIMETEYNIRATPKMYKNQFARWGFFKYAVKRRPRPRTESPTEAKHEQDPLDGAIILGRDALLYDSDRSRQMQAGLTAVRRFLHGHLELDPANRTAEEVAGFVDPFYRYFKTAMDLFDLRENVAGGGVLRLAFLQIERKMANPTMKTFSDLCFLVPHLLLESNRRDILAAYLRYLARLATVKFGRHPIAELAAALASMVDRPREVMRYIMLLSQINSDTISGVDGILDRTARWAQFQYLACQRTIMEVGDGDDDGGGSGSGSGSDDEPPQYQQQPPPQHQQQQHSQNSQQDTQQHPQQHPQQQQALTTTTATASRRRRRDRAHDHDHDHHMIRLEAQSVYWAQNLVMRGDPESSALAEQWLRREFDPDFAPRCEAVLAGLRSRAATGELAPYFAKMMECLAVGWLSDYYETVRRWDKVFEWGREGLALSRDEQYVIWSIHLEELMRRYGDPEEAEELKRRRWEHGWLERVRVEVDRLNLG